MQPILTSSTTSMPLVLTENPSSSTTNIAGTSATISKTIAVTLGNESETTTPSSSTFIPRSAIASSSSTSINTIPFTISSTIQVESLPRLPVEILSNSAEFDEVNSTAHITGKALGCISINYISKYGNLTAFVINDQAQLDKFVKEHGLREEQTKRLDSRVNLTTENLVLLYLSGGSSLDSRSNYVSKVVQIGQNFRINLVHIPKPGVAGTCAMIGEFIVLGIPKTDVSIEKICVLFEDHKKDELDTAYEICISTSNRAFKEVLRILTNSGLKSSEIYTFRAIPENADWFAKLSEPEKSLVMSYVKHKCDQSEIRSKIAVRDNVNRLPEI